jgi:hypothetical protein
MKPIQVCPRTKTISHCDEVGARADGGKRQAELPMTTAPSLTARSALASATSVFSEMSEDVAPILPAGDEHRPASRREEEAAHDHPQVAGIHRWKPGRQPQAHL